MISATQKDLSRASALLLSSVLVASGCGSSATPTISPSQTVSQAASTTATAGASSTRRSHEISRGGDRRSGITGEAVTSECAVLPAGEQTCPRQPVLATIEVLQSPSGHEIAIVHTNRAGRFRLSVPPGAYQLASQTPGFLLFAPRVALRVRSHHFEHVQLSFIPRHPLPVASGPAGCKACPPSPP